MVRPGLGRSFSNVHFRNEYDIPQNGPKPTQTTTTTAASLLPPFSVLKSCDFGHVDCHVTGNSTRDHTYDGLSVKEKIKNYLFLPSYLGGGGGGG